ncbi:cobalt-precorrin-5B (C(1))-methyltransferase CbiD [Marvinbryantia formatexigens]|nr:cobalt-precorrin-5B (C(1))-methyltransferase CbiD [Marvinbryantia formatexigens]UWO25112.1 cobalt-precorrin-5B (C(1))-methyltransferase CbiD [Marvinbryantia formatexigens DSM 14469]SDG95927.1 cobalt-precorrin 5B C1-methyltransferase [Marvinbryantia formatexigens]
MEHRTGLEDRYVLKNNKRLRCGYTTGTCAAAAAKAAALMLFLKKDIPEVELVVPEGTRLHLAVEEICRRPEEVSCAVRKDGGDDPDVTHGLLIFARVKKTETDGVQITGGRGVGTVTKKGLWQPVGEAAINRVPREMITRALEEVCEELEQPCRLAVEISAPGGEEIALRTFNPRLGITGGISILGTSGIVVPMSEEALVASIRLEMEMKRAAGRDYLLITPGNYGEDFLREGMQIDTADSMKCSNYVGETLDMAVELGVRGILFVAHIGKFIKVSGGIMNTHSRAADCRAELMAAQALRAGADAGTAMRILDTITTEEALDILEEKNLTEKTMKEILPRIRYYMQHRCGGALQTEAVIFSNQHGYLGETEGAGELLEKFRVKE